MNAALPFATQQLDKRGAFLPFGVAIDSAGQVRMLAGDPGQGESPEGTAVLAIMVEGLRRERDDLRAVALVADVRHTENDAVRVQLEHREGQAIAVLLPYKKKRFGRGIDYADVTAVPGEAQIWNE